MAARRSRRLDILDAPAAPQTTRAPGGGILPHFSPAERARLPRPRRVVDDPALSVTGPADTNIHIDTATGAAIITRGNGVTELDFSGRDTAKERRPLRKKGDFYENLALDPEVQKHFAEIVADLEEDISDIKTGRAEWEEAGNKGAELLGTKWEEAASTASADGTISNTRHPLMLEAVMRSWANSRAELLPSEGPIKVRDDTTAQPAAPAGMGHNGGPPLDGAPAGGVVPGAGPGPMVNGATAPPQVMVAGTPDRMNLAAALQKTMNHYLTVVDREYYGDFSSMLMTRALKGSQFRKVYFDPIKHRPVARWVKGTDLYVSNDCSHLSGASVIAERMPTRHNVLRRMIKAGAWRDTTLPMPHQETTSTDRTTESIEGVRKPTVDRRTPYEIYECRVELDQGVLGLDEKGNETNIALPYKVTIDLQAREVLEIRRNWKKGDKNFRARVPYVHYGFVPGLGFYHWGFVHILGNPERAATALLREFIDAEMLASFPGGVMQKSAGTRTNTTNIRPGPGQFEVVDTGGVPISEFMQAFKYSGASPQLNAVLENVVTNARRVAGTIELPVGEGRSASNVPSVTVMAFIDAISKVPSAIHKDDHQSQQEEYQLLKELLAQFPQCLEPPTKSLTRDWTKAELMDANLVPAADPNSPSFVHRLMQGAALVQAAGMPQFASIANQREVWALMLAILGFGDRMSLTMPEQPQGAAPPDPKALAAAAQAQTDKEKNEIALQKLAQEQTDTQREAANQSLEADLERERLQSEERIRGEELQVERERIAAEQRRADADRSQDHVHHVVSEGLEHQRHTDTLGEQREARLNDENEDGES